MMALELPDTKSAGQFSPTGETLVEPGDTVVLPGSWHAWRNRSDAPCTIAALHISVVR